MFKFKVEWTAGADQDKITQLLQGQGHERIQMDTNRHKRIQTAGKPL